MAGFFNKYLQHVDGGSVTQPPMESFPEEAVAAELQDLGDMKNQVREEYVPIKSLDVDPKFIPFFARKRGPGFFLGFFLLPVENEKRILIYR